MSRIYLHEVMYTVAGREEPYMASVSSLHFDPVRAMSAEAAGYGKDDYTNFLQFRSAEAAGTFPRVINIWEMSWPVFARALAGQFRDSGRDSGMEDWWNRNLHLRRGGYDRVMIPAAYSPSGPDLAGRSVRREVFLQEIIWLPLGEPERYLGEFEQKLLPVATRLGIELVGAWRVAMRPRQVVTVLAAADWSDFSRLVEAQAESPELRGWRDYRAKQIVQSEPMVGLPARHQDMSVRREPPR